MLANILSKSETFTQLRELFALYKTLKLSRKLMLLSIILSMLTATCNVISLRLLVPFIHAIISSDNSTLLFLLPILEFLPNIFSTTRIAQISLIASVILLFSAFKNIFAYLSLSLSTKQAMRADKKIKNLIFKKYLGFGKLFFDQKSIGELNNILLNSAGSISSQLISIQKILAKMFALIGYLAILFYISIKLTLCAVIILPLSHLFVFKISRKIKDRSRNLSQKQAVVSKSLVELLFCIPLIQTFGKEESELLRFKKESNAYLRSHFAIVNLENILPPLKDMLSICSLVLIAIILPFVEQLPCSSARASELILFFLILRISIPSVNALHDLHTAIAKNSTNLKKINLIIKGREKWFVKDGKLVFDKLTKSILFKDLNFKFSNRRILKKINLEIKKGSKIGIVGESGAGKTILANLLLRFYEVAPKSIFIDGVDIKKFNIKSLRSKIAYISQDVILFDSSLRENILYGYKQTHSENAKIDLEQVLSKANLRSLVAELPEGLETRIGLAGKLISGGEKTRVALARTLLLESEILIFDEASSSLDNISEEEITKAIEDISKDKTSIHIVHRLKNIDSFDKIVVLEKGSIVEQGSPKELLAKKGVLYNYWIREHSLSICPECEKVHSFA